MFTIPTPYTNRFAIQVLPEAEGLVRLSFGERAPDGKDVMFASVMMTRADFVLLITLGQNALNATKAVEGGLPADPAKVVPILKP